MDGTDIEWTNATWNMIRARRRQVTDNGAVRERVGWHCEHASPGCRRCYAEGINRRLGTGLDFKPVHLVRPAAGQTPGESLSIWMDRTILMQPVRWRDPRRIFPCAMTDLFGAFVPEAMIDAVFAVMLATPRHTYQVLTKRAQRMRLYVNDPGRLQRIMAAGERLVDELQGDGNHRVARAMGEATRKAERPLARTTSSSPDEHRLWPLPNVWLGVSAEDQRRADERVYELVRTRAVQHWVSVEPMLGAVDFTRIRTPVGLVDALRPGRPAGLPAGEGFTPLSWVVPGGESGSGCRPSHPDWFRQLHAACVDAGTAFFFKQHGGWVEDDTEGPVRDVFQHDALRHPRRRPRRGFISLSGHFVRTIRDAMPGAPYRPILNVGKRKAGAHLDGSIRQAYPASSFTEPAAAQAAALAA